MIQPNSLLEQLIRYGEQDFYPFHMPGHKRKLPFPDPFSIDITEIHGFDNLHHPESQLKESMEMAARIYKADRSYYLVNGSTGGILSAICSSIPVGGKILMARNCHKSTYHGVFLQQLEAEYIYPQFIQEFQVFGGLLADNIRDIVDKYCGIQAIFVVSPSYEGIVVDIGVMAEIAHAMKIPLIVDEAHGAHFQFGTDFPTSALELGADIVIQSLHKTLPSLTQTAILHVRQGFVDVERLEFYLQLFQSSSPSYVMMASMENCIRFMDGEGRERMDRYGERLARLMKNLAGLRNFRVMGDEIIGTYGVFDRDPSKLLISTGGCQTGVELAQVLRERYHLETEMAGGNYVLAMTSLMDTEDGFERLEESILALDKEQNGPGIRDGVNRNPLLFHHQLKCEMSMAAAMAAEKEDTLLRRSIGRIAAEMVTVYPPGIPLLVPGEVIEEPVIEAIEESRRLGLSVQGMKDQSCGQIQVTRGRTYG